MTKMTVSALDAARQFRFLVMMLLALLNRRSLATDVAGTSSNCLPTWAIAGYCSWFTDHHASGQSARRIVGVNRYNLSSCCSASWSDAAVVVTASVALAVSSLSHTEERGVAVDAAVAGEVVATVVTGGVISANVAFIGLAHLSSDSNTRSLNRGSTTIAAHNSSSSKTSWNFSLRERIITSRSTSRPPAVEHSRSCSPSMISSTSLVQRCWHFLSDIHERTQCWDLVNHCRSLLCVHILDSCSWGQNQWYNITLLDHTF